MFAPSNIRPPADDHTIVDDLVARRKELHMRQGDVAQLMHTTQSSVCQFERGANPTLSTVLRYAEAVSVSVTMLVEPLPSDTAEAET